VTVVVDAVVQPNPLVTAYEIVDVPAAAGLRTPPALIVTTDVFDELHTPPAVTSDNVTPLLLVQILMVPVMAATTGLTLTVTVVETVVVQPDPLVTAYEIVDVPAATPVTSPVALIVATAVLDELHTPAGVASDNVVILPRQTEVVPVMAATTGNELIVTDALP
jgi:hypothetical protein